MSVKPTVTFRYLRPFPRYDDYFVEDLVFLYQPEKTFMLFVIALRSYWPFIAAFAINNDL